MDDSLDITKIQTTQLNSPFSIIDFKNHRWGLL